jgi:hypothetical protein
VHAVASTRRAPRRQTKRPSPQHLHPPRLPAPHRRTARHARRLHQRQPLLVVGLRGRVAPSPTTARSQRTRPTVTTCTTVASC